MERNEDWFAGLYREHLAQVNAYCVRRVGAAEAGDVVARVFAVAWDKRDRMPDDGEELPWLYAVARNVVRHQWRSSARTRRLHEKVSMLRPISGVDTETVMLERAEHEQVRRALGSLSESDQEVLRLFAWERMSARQVASVTGLSEAAAEKRLARAKLRLARRYRSITATRSPMRRRKEVTADEV